MTVRTYNFDNDLNIKNAGAVTATAVTQISGFDTIRDVGNARFEGVAVINVSAIDTADVNETYSIAIEGSNAADFSSGVEALVQTVVTAAGRIELPFVNVKYGTTYRYLRVKHTLGGTTPSLNYSCYFTAMDGWC